MSQASLRLLYGIVLAASPLTAADFATGADWPSYGGTYSALRYSALDQVNASNVQKLAPAWIFQTGDKESGLQATPIVINGVMYVSSASNWVFALEADTGKMLWEYRFPLPSRAQLGYGRQNRGVAVGHERVFMGTADNHMLSDPNLPAVNVAPAFSEPQCERTTPYCLLWQ